MRSRTLERFVSGRLRYVALVLMVLTALIAALSVSGCGSEAQTTTTGSETTSTTMATTTVPPASSTTLLPETTTTEPESTTTTEPLSSAEILLPNGNIRAMGYIDRVWESGGKRYISIDYAEMLTGEEARDAAIGEGVIGPDEDLPNDYFITNENPKKREFTVSLSVSVATSTVLGGGMDEPSTWAEFKSFWSDSPPEGTAHLHLMPWWIERAGTEVISITEQYLP